MNFIKSKLIHLICAIALIGVFVAADHIDAPAVAGTSSDITDLYVFQSPENASNLVFVCNLKGLLDPTATAGTSFDPDLMVEFNIDNDGDNREDFVIQCLYLNDELVVYGPATPRGTGTSSMVNTDGAVVRTAITDYQKPTEIGQANGMKAFAGPRDDPFFFDFNQYSAILGGMASGFNNPGNDTFAGTNVMSTVVEVPKSMLGGSGTLNVWVETKRSKS